MDFRSLAIMISLQAGIVVRLSVWRLAVGVPLKAELFLNYNMYLEKRKLKISLFFFK